MQKTVVSLPDIKLMGITCRTNNASEATQDKAQIGRTVQNYFANGLSAKIANRARPGVTYSAYTNYASDANGDYDYFIGEEVTSFDEAPEGFATLTIPAQTYAKFTTQAGQMPAVCINAWQQIWAMSPEDLDGQRAFLADFELYDERAMNPAQTILDVFIGLKS